MWWGAPRGWTHAICKIVTNASVGILWCWYTNLVVTHPCTKILLCCIIQTPRGLTSRKTSERVRLCIFFLNNYIALAINDFDGQWWRFCNNILIFNNIIIIGVIMVIFLRGGYKTRTIREIVTKASVSYLALVSIPTYL